MEIRGRIQRALLGRLVVGQGRVISVDRLVDDIWDGEPPPTAAAVIQVQIHNLRRVFEPERPRRAPAEVVVSEAHGYALRLPSEQVDAWHFEALLRAYQERVREPAHPVDLDERCRLLDEVLASWHGPALESFDGDRWAAAETARLTDLLLLAAESRAEAALALDRPSEVVTGLRPLLEQHPEREECARLVATAQYRLGQQVEALGTVRRAREFLIRELGVDPGRRLRALETAILTHADILDGSEPEPDSPTAVDAGYSHQRAVVLAAADDVRASGIRVVWLAGEAGMGKSFLADSIAVTLERESWTVARGRCAGATAPARAWAEIVGRLDGSDGIAESLSAERYVDVARAVVRRCRSATRTEPIALILEDLHRADRVTSQILRLVTTWLRRVPVLVLITLRPSEADADLRATVTALADRTASWEELNGLGLDAVARIAHEAGAGPVDRATVEVLRERTGGNPLFVRQLAEALVNRGDIYELPPRIRDVLRARVRRLPEEVVRTLRYVAVLGSDAEIAVLLELLDRSESDLLDQMTVAQTAGLARFDASGRIGFDNTLIRDTIYRDIPPEQRADMRGRASYVLEHRAVR